jgi:hypothetical protein
MKLPRPRSLKNVSLIDLRRRISSLRDADMQRLSDEAVASRIARIIDQFPIQLRPLLLTGLYRARLNDGAASFGNASELWYPPGIAITRPGRLNRIGEPCFYASSTPNTAMLELHPVAGQTVTVVIAATRSGLPETLQAAFIGLERCTAADVGHLTEHDMFRHSPQFRQQLGEGTYRKWLAIDDYLSDILGQNVPRGEEHRYRPSIALAERLFTAPTLNTINYPSVASNDKGINLAMLPARADELFRPLEAWMIEIGESALHPQTGELLTETRFIRRSREIGADGVIHWLAPGEGINLNEIMRFARRRIETLPTRPAPAPR